MQLKEVKTFSASSVSTFLDCPRKWWFKYVLGVRVPPSKAMAHGTGVHKDVEGYYLEDTPLTTPEAVELHSNGYMPERELVTGVEFNASELGLELEGLRLLGYIDLIAIDPETGDERIIDWKTRSSFSYAPGTAELEQDIAGRIYAWIFFERALHQDTVNFEHGNMLRVDGKRNKTPRSMLASCDYDREEIYRWVGGPLASIVREMKRTAMITDPRQIPQSTDACFKYGPCEYKDRPMGPLRGRSCYDLPFAATNPNTRKQGETMSLLGLAKKKKAAAESSAPSAPETKTPEEPTAPAQETAPATTEPGDALERAKADFVDQRNGLDLQSYGLTPQELRQFVAWRNAFTKAEQEAQAANPIPEVNPPDAAPDETPVDLEDQEIDDFDFESVNGIGPKSGANLRAYIAEKGITRLVQVLDLDLKKHVDGIGKKGEDALFEAIKAQKNWTPEGDLEPATPIEQSAKKPGAYDQHALLVKAKAIDSGEDQSEPLEHVIARMDGVTEQKFRHWQSLLPQSEYVKNEAGQVEHRVVGSSGLQAEVVRDDKAAPSHNVLYVDCYPIAGTEKVVSLDDLLRPLKDRLAKEEGVRYWSADKYGKGRKILVEMVLEDPSFLRVGHVVALSGREGMEQLIPEIEQFFDLVVVGPGR